jgi:hypothetical protein
MSTVVTLRRIDARVVLAPPAQTDRLLHQVDELRLRNWIEETLTAMRGTENPRPLHEA